MIKDNVVSRPDHRPILYFKADCPWSLRFLVFAAEVGLLPELQVVRYNPDAEGFDDVRRILEVGTGKAPAFPTVELPSGVFLTDSSALIDRFCAERGVRRDGLVALDLFERGLLRSHNRMYAELKALRSAGTGGA